MADILNRELVECLIQLNEAEQNSILQMLKTFIKSRKHSSEYITVEEYNQELQDAEQQIEKGDFTTQEDLENEMKGW